MQEKKKKILKSIIRLVFFLLVVIFAIWLSKLAKDSDLLKQLVQIYGYWAIFGISTISGFNLVVPIPAISFLPLFMASGLNFWLTILLITLGMSLADSLVYFLGRAGREITLSAIETKIFYRLDKWRDSNYWWPLIVCGLYVIFIPLPNEIIIIPLALLDYKLKHLLIILLLGNFLFNIFFYFGLINLF